MNAADELGRRIEKLRRSRGLSQNELGRRFGVSQQQVAKLEAGRGGYSLTTLDKIARALGLRLEIAFRPVRPVDREEAEEISANLRWFRQLGPIERLRSAAAFNRATGRLMRCKRKT